MRFVAASLLALGALLATPSAIAEPSTLAISRLGTPAVELLAPPRRFFALVSLPPSVDAERLGLRPVVPGLAVIDGDAARVAGFARAHPELGVEIRPPLRIKLDVARAFVGAPSTIAPSPLDGAGTYVGIVDTGLDITHPDFRNGDGTTRIAWFLDYAGEKREGNALDRQYGGRVWERSEIDAILKGAAPGKIPGDDEGHGTHVTGIAAGNGGPSRTYVGLAPKADLIIVRASDAAGGVDEGAAILGAKFVFDRAAEAKAPAVVNLSLGTQYGAHDGTSKFERGLTELAKGPGRAIVVAASNEGHIPIHTSVRVSPGGTYRIPVQLRGADGRGAAYRDAQVFVWVNKRDRGDVRLGVRGPGDAPWMAPVARGEALETKPAKDLRVLVANDVPKFLDGGDTSGAIAVLQGPLPVGTFELELEGDGAVEIWLQGAREAIDGPGMPFFQRGGQIEGTIGVPASAAGLLSVGCVGTRTEFVNQKKRTVAVEDAVVGGRCFFSSAGPAANGPIRPDILAPGHYVISSLARSALLAAPGGAFDTSQIIDPEHGALAGTSMSAPFAAGAAALLFQRDPTLDQDGVRALLQAGARPLVDDPPGFGSSRDFAKGAGILDVAGALAALDRRPAPPAATSLSLRLGATYLAADGGLPLYGLATAHDANGLPADVPGGGLILQTEGANVRDALEHPAVGVYRFSIVAQPGRGGTSARVRLGPAGALQSAALTIQREIPIGADRWDARDGLRAGGGCAVGGGGGGEVGALAGLLLSLTSLRRCRARSRAPATAARSDATGAPDRRG